MKKDEKTATNLIALFNLLSNDNRRKILKLCFEKPITIAELNRELKSKDKITRDHLQKLLNWDMVILDRKDNEKHHPVYVTSKFLPEWFDFLIKALKKDIKNTVESIRIIQDAEMFKKGSNEEMKSNMFDYLMGNKKLPSKNKK